jgi:hypothetical protein
MLLLQTQIVVASWVGPTIALSLVVIAAAFGVIALALAAVARKAAIEVQHIGRAVEGLRADLAPTLESLKGMGHEVQRLTGVVGEEAEQIALSSHQFRLGVQERIANLEAIYDVLEGEIEETALDLATTMRAFRTRAGWYRWVRRLLGAGSRR